MNIGFEKHGLLLSHYGWPLKSNRTLPGSWINHVPGKGVGLGFSLSGPTSGEGSGVRGLAGQRAADFSKHPSRSSSPSPFKMNTPTALFGATEHSAADVLEKVGRKIGTASGTLAHSAALCARGL